MDFEQTEEQHALVEALERVLRSLSTPDRVRAAEAGDGFDGALWRALVAMGVPVMTAPEPVGTGAGLLDAELVCEAAGAAMAPVPLSQSLVAARLLAHHAPGVAPGIASGEIVVLAEAADALVPFLPVASAVFLAAGREAVQAYALDRRGEQVRPLRMTSLESAGRIVDLGALRPLGPPQPAPRWQDEIRVLEAGRLAGLAQRALETTVTYVKERRQFDRPIGAFQALQHRLADLATAVDGARLLAREAAWRLDGDGGPVAMCHAVYARCAAVAGWAAREGVQMHGGYGFMLEYDVQMCLRRARAWGSWLAPVRDDLARAADDLFGPPDV